MNNKFYTVCGAMALALAACSENNGGISGTSTEPNPSYAEGLSLWNPQSGDYHVNTALYAARLSANVQADGHWFWEARGADENEGGQSSIIWPVALGGDADSLSTVIESCQGICGIADLKKGSMTMQPFAAVGFVMARDEAGEPVPVDVSDWNGVCISYTSDEGASLVLDLGDSLGALLDDGFGFPAVALPKALDPVTKCFNWSQFEFPLWKKEFPNGWNRKAGVQSAKQLIGLMFRIQNESGQYNFNIKYFGTKADGASETEAPVILSGAGEDGRWYWATDEDAGGRSSVQWPVALGSDGSLAPVVEQCKGVCGVASLKKGTSQENPYVSLGFGIAKDASGEPLPVDVSNWEGLCFEYYSDTPVTVELVVSDTSDGLPQTKLRSSQEIRKVCVDWYAFRLPKDSVASNEGDVESVQELNDMMLRLFEESGRIALKVKNAVKQTISVRLKIEAAEEGDYKFGFGTIDAYFTSNQTDSDD